MKYFLIQFENDNSIELRLVDASDFLNACFKLNKIYKNAKDFKDFTIH